MMRFRYVISVLCRFDLVNGIIIKVITLDPSSPWGYERKHAALHEAGRYDHAIATFEMMLLKISQSPDPEIRSEYIDIIPMFIY